MTKTKKKLMLVFIGLLVCVSIAFLFKFNTPKSTYADTVATQNVVEQTGLGLGINVLTAKNYNEFKTGYSVFNDTNLQNLTTSKITLNETQNSSYSTTDINELMARYEISFGANVGVEAFLSKIEADLSQGTSINFQNYLYKYFYTINSYINRYQLYINNYQIKSTYANCFSTNFLSDLNQLYNKTMSYDTFFNNYGTHIVGSAIYGGKLNAYYTVVSNNIEINATNKNTVDMCFSGYDFSNTTKNSIVANINSKQLTTYNATDIETSFYIKAQGGDVFSSSSIGDFNNSYTNWCNSFNDNTVNSVLINYTNEGLVPLWEILPDSYSSIANVMKNKFIQYYQNSSNEFMDKFTGNYVEFSGGTGEIGNPYIVTSPNQLFNIKDNKMSSNYVLKNDLDLSNIHQWVPIGGFYKKSLFNGVFEGNNYTIKNLTRTEDIPETQDWIYFGFFGCIGERGNVKNLNFENVNINMTGPARDDAGTRLFIGTVAGNTHGTLSNININSGTVTFSKLTNGCSFVGGVVGLANNTTINNCHNFIVLNSFRYTGLVGGIAGYARGTTFNNCTNSGKLTAKCTQAGGIAYAGGIVAETFKTEPCYNNSCNNYGELKAIRYGGLWGGTQKTGEFSASNGTKEYN